MATEEALEQFLPVVKVSRSFPRKYTVVGAASRWVVSDLAVTARHVLADKYGGELHKDTRISVFERGMNGMLGESAIERIFVHEHHDVAVLKLHPPAAALVRPDAAWLRPLPTAVPVGTRIQVAHWANSVFTKTNPANGDGAERIHTAPTLSVPEIEQFANAELNLSIANGDVVAVNPDGGMSGGIAPSYQIECDQGLPSASSGAPVYCPDTRHLIGVVSTSEPTDPRKGTVVAVDAVRELLCDDRGNTLDDYIEWAIRGLDTMR